MVNEPSMFELLRLDCIVQSGCQIPASILSKSIAGRYRPVRVADGPITARCRFIKNAYWDQTGYLFLFVYKTSSANYDENKAL